MLGVIMKAARCSMNHGSFIILVFSSVYAMLSVLGPAEAACNVVDGKAYGDCAGVRVVEGTNGHLTIRSDRSESAIIDGATILRGGTLHLSGVSNGDILVHRGASLRLTGVVNGTIKNEGGTVEVEGLASRVHTNGGNVVIGGNVGSVSGEGTVTYKRGALIGGVPVEKTVRTKGKR